MPLCNLLNKFISTPKAISTIPNTNYLIITEYALRMERVLNIFNLIDQPGPARKLVPIHVEHITAQQAKAHIDNLLKESGLERIEAVGKPFDPLRHEAVMVEVDPELESNTVTAEIEPGYVFRGALLRPAKVKVAQ